MQNDVNDMLVEKGRQFGAPSEFEDLVWLQVDALDCLCLLRGSNIGAFGRRLLTSLQRDNFRNLKACRMYDILQVARSKPAQRLPKPAEGLG